MEILEAIRKRRAIRSFLDRPVERDLLSALVAAATQAPSAMNLQPWGFLIVQGKNEVKRLSDAAKAHLLRIVDPASPLAKYRDELSDPGFELFYGAPALIVVCARGAGSAGIVQPNEDCCLAAQDLMLAAVAQGLGSCWIGFSRPWLNQPAAKRALGLPADWSPVAPLAIGYPAEMPTPPGRHAPEIVWHPAA
jgi:nitroreductase